LNYFNYFTEIEQFYQARRDSFTLLSTLDWVLIENWKEQGVPLDFVLKGIDRAFSRAKRRINSLAYCIKAVEEIIEEQKETRVERPESQQISRQETRQYLEDLAEKTAAVSQTFPEFAAKINVLAESVRVVDAGNFRDAEQILEALEERLIAILRVAADESILIEVQRDVEAELGPFRSTMTTPQLAMLEQQLARRKLLERYNVPRLSLFYLM
jgi:cobalamin biosynthesis Mg chelatase CobN